MTLKTLVELIEHSYTGMAFGLTVFVGLLTIMGERFLYARRGYKREAKITAFFGWFYVVGGTTLFVLLAVLRAIV